MDMMKIFMELNNINWKQNLDNIINKMTMEELEILLEKAKEIEQIKGD